MSVATQKSYSSLQDTARVSKDRANVEPSMEEILASIRRIIADDQAHMTPPPLSDSIATPEVREGSSITFQRERLEEDAPADASSANILANNEKASTASVTPESKTTHVPQSTPHAIEEKAEQTQESLLSTEAGASASSAFDSLSSLVLNRNPRTMDDLVQDMLRPLLKAWLDENLPPLVEKLVRTEIERISRGNR